MLLQRIGNKKKIAPLILAHIPRHDIWIEPFFGVGGMFFSKPMAEYNYLNDIDNDVFNIFYQTQFNSEKLYKLIDATPYCKSVFNWLKNENFTDDIWRAVRFAILSNYSFLGTGNTLELGISNSKKILLQNIAKTNRILCDNNVKINNCDFRVFLNEFSFREEKRKKNAFIYCDPPYIGTYNNYSDSFTLQDTTDLFDICVNSGIRFAISEFDNPIIKDLATERGLNIIPICERQTLGSRSTEILITNYESENTLF